jgi:hypothetical protein
MDKTHTQKVKRKFPWRGKFRNKQEIDHYFSGNKIQCLLCGNWFKIISSHLKRIHDIDSYEYREKYGLPWKHGLCGKEVSLKLSKAMKKRRENGFLPDIDAAREKSKHATKRHDQPFLKKVKSEILNSSNNKRQKYSKVDYQNILIRMLKEEKSLHEVCKGGKDADIPGDRRVSKYAKRNKEFKKALDETYAKLPFSVQAKAGRLAENKFRKELMTLQRSGLSIAEMARYLGVSKNLTRNRFRRSIKARADD